MAEVIPFDVASRRLPSSAQEPRRQLPYETYAAYQQAESAFRALYFGRPLDTETLANRPSTRIVQRHWATVEQLAETLLRERSLRREQVIKLLLQASLGNSELQYAVNSDRDPRGNECSSNSACSVPSLSCLPVAASQQRRTWRLPARSSMSAAIGDARRVFLIRAPGSSSLIRR